MATYFLTPDPAADDAGLLQERLQTLIDKAQPGDAIILQPGVYHLSSSLRIHGRSGTDQKPVVISSAKGGRATLDGSRITDTGYYGGWVVDVRDASFLHIDGLEIRYGPEGGLILRGGSNFNILENLDVHHNGRLSSSEGKGVTVTGTGSGNLLLNNDSHDNRDLRLDNADGFQISSTGSGNVLHGNRAWNNADDGFDFFNVIDGSHLAPVIVQCNVAFRNGYVDGHTPAGDGVGFKLGGSRLGSDSVSGGHRVEFNLAWENRSTGFDENGAKAPMIVTNNVAIDHENYNFFFENPDSTISKNRSLGIGRVTPAVEDHTLPNLVAVQSETMQAVKAAAAGPREQSGDLPALTFSLIGGDEERSRDQTCGPKWQSNLLPSRGEHIAPSKSSMVPVDAWTFTIAMITALIAGIVWTRTKRHAWLSSKSLARDHGSGP